MTGAFQNWLKPELLCAVLGVVALAGCEGAVTGAGFGPGQAGINAASGGAGSSGPGGVNAGASGMSKPATDPGRVTMHRLNLAEYDNTMRDLLGTSTHPSADFGFPADDRGSDFDNTADVLTVSPLHLSCYNNAATALVAATLADSALRSHLVSCDLKAAGAACAQSALESFLPRAWRREVTSTEETS